MNIKQSALFSMALMVSTTVCAGWDAEHAASRIPDSGEFHLALFNGDDPDGFMRLGWYHVDETLVVYDRTMMPSAEIYEIYSASMDANNLAPESIRIRFHQGTAALTIEARLSPEGIRGTRTVERIGQETDVTEIDVSHPEGTIFRALSFLLPAVLDTDPGQQLSYTWYSPLRGLVEQVTLTSVDGGEVTTPAGQFETTRWELRGGNPENDIYVARGDAPRIVRIDVLGQALRFMATE